MEYNTTTIETSFQPLVLCCEGLGGPKENDLVAPQALIGAGRGAAAVQVGRRCVERKLDLPKATGNDARLLGSGQPQGDVGLTPGQRWGIR